MITRAALEAAVELLREARIAWHGIGGRENGWPLTFAERGARLYLPRFDAKLRDLEARLKEM